MARKYRKIDSIDIDIGFLADSISKIVIREMEGKIESILSKQRPVVYQTVSESLPLKEEFVPEIEMDDSIIPMSTEIDDFIGDISKGLSGEQQADSTFESSKGKLAELFKKKKEK